MILKVDFELKLSYYTLAKRFIKLNWVLKNVVTILDSQFNYHTLSVAPFKLPIYPTNTYRCFMVQHIVLKKVVKASKVVVVGNKQHLCPAAWTLAAHGDQ